MVVWKGLSFHPGNSHTTQIFRVKTQLWDKQVVQLCHKSMYMKTKVTNFATEHAQWSCIMILSCVALTSRHHIAEVNLSHEWSFANNLKCVIFAQGCSDSIGYWIIVKHHYHGCQSRNDKDSFQFMYYFTAAFHLSLWSAKYVHELVLTHLF